MLGMPKKYFILLVFLIFLVLLGTTLAVLYGTGTIEFEESHHSGSGENSDGNTEDKKKGWSVINNISFFYIKYRLQ